MKPTYKIDSVSDLNLSFLKDEKIKIILFDADSTLIEAKSENISGDTLDKINEISENGIKTVIASNGKTKRIKKVFKGHNILAYGMSFKPLPFKLRKLTGAYKKNEVLLVGDQLFTDILCANLLGIRSIMVNPYGKDKGYGMKLKRKLEKRLLRNYSGKQI